MNHVLTLLAFAFLLFFQVPSFAVLGRWIDPESNRAHNGPEAASFLQAIGALRPLSFIIISTDRVDEAAGTSMPIKGVATLKMEHVGNGKFKVESGDTTISNGNRVFDYQVESFSRENGVVVLGQITPAYDSRHRIYVSLHNSGDRAAMKISMVRNVEQRSYESEFIPTKVLPIPKESSTRAIVENLLQNVVQRKPIQEKKIQSGNRIAEMLNDGSILLTDSETKKSVNHIEPLGSNLDNLLAPDFYFDGFDLVIEYKDIGQRLVFSSQDGKYLKIEPLIDKLMLQNVKIVKCKSLLL